MGLGVACDRALPTFKGCEPADLGRQAVGHREEKEFRRRRKAIRLLKPWASAAALLAEARRAWCWAFCWLERGSRWRCSKSTRIFCVIFAATRCIHPR